MTEERLNQIMEQFPKLRVAVVGDLFLDKWLEIDRSLDEPSVETGITAYQVVKKRVVPGAMGTILRDLHALGIGKITPISFIGEDGEGWEIRRALKAMGMDDSRVRSDSRLMTPTYVKPLFMENGVGIEDHRLDYRNTSPTPYDLEDSIIDSIYGAAGALDALIVLDQLTDRNTGVVTDRLRDAVCAVGATYPKMLVFADSRAFLHEFRNITIKCNHKEAAFITGHEAEPFNLDTAAKCMEDMETRTNSRVIVTCGERGILVKENGIPALLSAVSQPGPIDVVGAGDMTSSAMVCALCAGANITEAAEIGNLAAGITLRKIGDTGQATPEEIAAIYKEASLLRMDN